MAHGALNQCGQDAFCQATQTTSGDAVTYLTNTSEHAAIVRLGRQAIVHELHTCSVLQNLDLSSTRYSGSIIHVATRGRYLDRLVGALPWWLWYKLIKLGSKHCGRACCVQPFLTSQRGGDVGVMNDHPFRGVPIDPVTKLMVEDQHDNSKMLPGADSPKATYLC